MAKTKLCSVHNCGKTHFAKGFCSVHYYRFRRHGDPLGGGPSYAKAGEPQRYYEEIVCSYDGDECLIWPFAKSSHGYGHMVVNKKTRLISRLICEETYGPPPTKKHEAAHSCGKGHEGCVNRHHLSWKTPKDNWADRYIHGTDNRGERNGRWVHGRDSRYPE